MKIKRAIKILSVLAIVSAWLPGCAGLPSSGPGTKRVEQSARTAWRIKGIQLVDVTDPVARRLRADEKGLLFSNIPQPSARPRYLIGPGDVLKVTVWEAPPATLFAAATPSSRLGITTTRATSFPPQMVDGRGMIDIPFAGEIPAAGRTPQQVETGIEKRLHGKANDPQVLVQVAQNNSEYVTVVGEVAASRRMPLTSRGERLLDALAAAGGVRQPVSKVSIQLTRGERVYRLPLETIIRDPRQNIPLEEGDVVTALYQPYSFTVLGATGRNAQVNFSANGISLAEALTRAGGIQDWRADARGVFIFRFEPEDAMVWPAKPVSTVHGKVPVIYWVNMKDPASFFVAQDFPIRNKDLVYVSNAPTTQAQKFINLVGSILNPALSAGSSAVTLQRGP